MKESEQAQALANIDKGMAEAAAITIEVAIEQAIERGMSIKEAELILEYFRRSTA